VKFQLFAGELCLDFINTLDNRPVPERRQELVPTYLDLLDWSRQAGSVSPAHHAALRREAESHPKDAAAVRVLAIELRECLYRIMSAIARHRRALAGDLRTLNGFLAQSLSNLELHPAHSGYRLDWPPNSTQLDSVLWPIARSASNLLTGDDLKYVRECGVGACRWLFVDRSKNHSRRWCDMKTCGNRMKARKFYRRQAATKAG
jgi:predicted RNA-binding Zn ribbon-like protein